jgi:hypothetical protein
MLTTAWVAFANSAKYKSDDLLGHTTSTSDDKFTEPTWLHSLVEMPYSEINNQNNVARDNVASANKWCTVHTLLMVSEKRYTIA